MSHPPSSVQVQGHDGAPPVGLAKGPSEGAPAQRQGLALERASAFVSLPVPATVQGGAETIRVLYRMRGRLWAQDRN